VDNVASLHELESADEGLNFVRVDSHSVASKALCLQQFVRLFEQEWIVNRNRQVDVANVARAVVNGHSARWALRLMIKGRHAQFLVVETLLYWVI